MSQLSKLSMNSPFEPKRRGFMSAAIYALATLMTGAFSASVSTYLFGKPETEDYGWADAGDVSDLQPGSPQQISFSRSREDGWKLRSEKSAAWVIVDERKHVTAFSPICTHLGCAYHWQMDRKAFACPCHGSLFSANGDVIAGPANRPLDRYSVKIEAGRLWLGPVQRSKDS
jgi:menaquinol-cytochrome c reductase iron-sulfur subunit